MSQTGLGDLVGVSRASIANIEAGRQAVRAEQVVELGAVLAVDPRGLLVGWAPTSAPMPKSALSSKKLASIADDLRKAADILNPTKAQEA
jgi:DNA-binding XRE family transcriptional regulator